MPKPKSVDSLAALLHAAAVPIFDEPGGQSLVLSAPRGNAAHNGAAMAALPTQRRTVRARVQCAPYGRMLMRARGCVRVRASAWYEGSAVESLRQASRAGS